MIIDLVKNGTKNFTFSIKEKFTTNLKDDCPIVTYSIVKVIEKISGKSINLTDSLELFNLDY